jgi:4-amino-4-deoxy-L-arabinose transferase-like glycosyltransferase
MATTATENDVRVTPDSTGGASVGKGLLLIGAIAFFIRAVYVIKYAQHLKLGWDATWYTGIGDSIAHGRGYAVTCPVISTCTVHQTALFPPVLPLIYAATAKIGLSSIAGRALVLAFLDSVTVVLTGFLGFRIGGRYVAYWAAVIAAVNPMMILLDGSLMTETVTALLAVVLLLLLVDQVRDPRTWRWFTMGGVCGVAALTRGEGPLWLIIVVLPAVYFVKRLSTKSRWMGFGIALATAAVIVSPWLIRNDHQFGTPYLSQPNLYGTLAATNCDAGYYGSTIGSWACGSNDALGFADTTNPNFSEPQAYDAARHRAVTYATHHVSRWPVVVVAREARAWSVLGAYQFQTGASSLRFSVTLFNWFLLVGSIAGFFVARKRRLLMWPLLCMIASVTLTIAATYGNPRYLASCVPALCVLTAIALVKVFDPERANRARAGTNDSDVPSATLPG